MKLFSFVQVGVLGLVLSSLTGQVAFGFGGGHVDAAPTVIHDQYYHDGSLHPLYGHDHTYYGVKVTYTFRRAATPKGSGIKNPSEQVLVYDSLQAAASWTYPLKNGRFSLLI